MVVRVGIVGCNYGRTVLLPAFRTDPRCEVVALVGTDAARTAELARQAEVRHGGADWAALIEDRIIDALAVAVPPSRQPDIACYALDRGSAVFVEKPLAADLAGARAMLSAAGRSGRPAAIDLNFPELPAWRRARAMLADGAIGRLRHAVVTWNTENRATRLRLDSWKTRGDDGGGVLGNFVSHCFHYLELFCGPVTGLNARIFPLPGKPRGAEAGVSLALEFGCGAGGSLQMSCASFLGSGHRIELYGEDGTLVLANPTADYFDGFTLAYARPPQTALEPVKIDQADAEGFSDSRVAPVARLVRRFIDACESGGSPSPGFAAGYRVQVLIDAARRANASGSFVAVPAPEAGEAGR